MDDLFQPGRPDHDVELVDYFVSGVNAGLLPDGPLAEQLSDALDQLYGKQEDASGVVLETQATDVAAAKKTWLSLQQSGVLGAMAPTRTIGLVYGIQGGQATVQDLIALTDASGLMSPQQRQLSAVVIDQPQPGFYPVEAALEQFCHTHGLSLYASVSEFLKRHRS